MKRTEVPIPTTVIEPDDLFRLRFLQSAKLAPDGKSIVYTVSHIDSEAEEEFITLWLLSLETEDRRQLTDGKARDDLPCWSPDGRNLAFRSTRTGKAQIHILDIGTRETNVLTRLPRGVGGGPAWSPDGKQIAFSAGPQGPTRDPQKPYRITRHIFRFDGLGNLDDAAQDVYVVPAEGGEVRRLTSDGCHNTRPQWSPAGNVILYLASFCPTSHRYPPRLRLVSLDGEVREVVGEWGNVTVASWLPDGKHIIFVGSPLERPFAEKSDLWVVNIRGGQPQCRTAGLALGVGGLISLDQRIRTAGSDLHMAVAPDGGVAHMMVQDGGQFHIYRIALAGAESCEPVVTGRRVCLLLDANEEQLLFMATTFHDLFNLYVIRLDGKDERKLTGLNDDLLAQRLLPTVEHLHIRGEDGVPVEGWLLQPATGEPPYPTILYIHGGRHAAFGYSFFVGFHMLAGAGYAVLLVNYRGSRGYGDKFASEVVGKWGTHDVGDLMAAVDHVVESGVTDPEHLGCCGSSAGGTLTCWIVSHTDRFKAAVAASPVPNWLSEHGTSDIGPWYHEQEFGGPLNETWEQAIRNSSIIYAHQCRTPTLLLHHADDFRCPGEQVEQFYTVLKSNGCIVEMVRFPGSSHAGARIGDPSVRRVEDEALLEWMNRYVLE